MAAPGNLDQRGGDAAQQLEQLFRRYHRPVWAYARRRVANDVADDVVANTFLVAWRRLEEVPAEALPWLLAVARNVIASQQRGLRRRGALYGRVQHDAATSKPSVVEEPTGRVAAALGRLSEPDREAITLIAWEGLQPAEAAKVVGQSAATFRVRLHRAKRRLRRELDRVPCDARGERHSIAKEMS
jgi:RNA polymerase sigma-70 factor (ECF subfamily)